MPRETPRIKVFRLEIDERRRKHLSKSHAERIANEIARLTQAPPTKTDTIQIDFDALKDERDFYRDLLVRLRNKVPASTHLSITALVSWCLYDTWISNLPTDECVPMFFRMGRDRQNVLVHLKLGRGFGCTKCDTSLGISLDEPSVNSVIIPSIVGRWREGGERRVYVFNPSPWTKRSVGAALALLH
jgi:hypothetical protein